MSVVSVVFGEGGEGGAVAMERACRASKCVWACVRASGGVRRCGRRGPVSSVISV